MVRPLAAKEPAPPVGTGDDGELPVVPEGAIEPEEPAVVEVTMVVEGRMVVEPVGAELTSELAELSAELVGTVPVLVDDLVVSVVEAEVVAELLALLLESPVGRMWNGFDHWKTLGSESSRLIWMP